LFQKKNELIDIKEIRSNSLFKNAKNGKKDKIQIEIPNELHYFIINNKIESNDVEIEKGSHGGGGKIEYFKEGDIVKMASGQLGIDGLIFLKGKVNEEERLITLCTQAKSSQNVDSIYYNAQITANLSKIDDFVKKKWF